MAQTAVDHKAQWETVNRVVYPVKDTDLTLPLYAVNWHPSHFDANVFDERDSRQHDERQSECCKPFGFSVIS